MSYLLLISCSGTKKSNAWAIPAIERYEGTTYKVIQKARREGYWPEQTDLFIISARYGLIAEHTLIEDYDQKMNQARALELQAEVSQAFDALLRAKPYTQIFVNMGKVYTQSIASSSEFCKALQEGRLQEAAGGIGERLRQTKLWLLKITEATQHMQR
jgi:hypothetical protein